MSSFEQIKKDIAENDVVLYMKGTSDFPQCGFSGLVVSILKKLNVKFKYINVLENDEIRESIKKFSDWPTIPQLYIKEEFIGGCDITREMYEKGELQNLLKEKKLLRNKYQETSAQTLDNVVYYEKGSYVLNLITRLNK